MKTKQIILSLMFAVLCSIGVWAEDGVIAVGNGSTASSYLPSYPNCTYSMSQQIYTKDEIGQAGMITSIAFYNYDTGSERNYDIYLSHTAKTSFDSSTDWVTVAAEDKVFSGTVTLKSDWTVIDFDTPFVYDGTQNLLLTVDDNTGKETGSNHLVGTYEGSGNQALYYYKMFGTPVNLDPTQSIAEEGSIYYRKNYFKLCFETYPKPTRLEAVEVGDVSAQIQCSLRGDATAWNLRYRKAGTETWTTFTGLTERSKLLEDLTAATKYEVQVQAVFPEDHQSGWTDPLVFTTNCCPVEEQAEIIYALNSNYSNYYGYAVQFIDITDENNPVEVAYINPPGYGLYGGSLTLCCGHQYRVNWIYDAEHANVIQSYSLALYFEPGDLFYSMARGTAPEETAELTTFVMDCTPYCVQMPQIVNEAGTTYDSATLTFVSQTKTGQVVYSTEEDFDPETATPADADFEELPQSEDPWGGTPPNTSVTLRGLQPLTTYYVSVRSVCTIEPLSTSRWTPPVKVTTGSSFDAPSQVIAEPINSRTEKLSWGSRGSEKGYNLYYRQQVAGTPVNIDAIQTFGGGNGTGFGYGSWGEGIWNSYGDRPFSNTIFVSDVPAGSSIRFLAGNGKTGAGQTKFLYGMQELKNGTPLEQMKKFDKKCLNDADRAAIIKELQNKIKELTDEEQIAAYNAEIEELNSLPTDAQKLEEMKTLEQKIKENNVAKAELTLKFVNGEITNEQYESEIYQLEVQNTMFKNKLSELRAITTNAEDPNNNGFAINSTGQSPAQSRGLRAAEDETYIFFIRHSDPNGVLLVKDLTITPPENLGAWTVIDNIKGTEYTLTGLKPETAYEVMVEPVYDDGTTGTPSVITVFTTLGTETDPTESEFSVAEGKKVNFAKGNLRCEGSQYEDEWSMAKQQYEVLGQDNIEVQGSRSYPAWLVDLFCWSTLENYYGVSSYYYYSDDDAKSFFNGDFADWGECPALIRDLGVGWSTLSKDEWNYLLNERANAQNLKALATVNEVKGLVILPDVWKLPNGATFSTTAANNYTVEQWMLMEQAGAVFLPAAGQMTTSYEDYNAITTVTEAGTYWTSTPSDDASGMKAFPLTFTDTDITLDTDLSRRVATAVRLVKVVAPKQELQNEWIAAIADQDCTGSELKPALTVKNGSITLTEGTDYTAAYSNNVNVGTATVTISAVESSNYTGTASATFTIVRDMSNVFSTGNSWATYIAQEDLTTPEGLSAYVVTDATTTNVTASPIDYIPATVGILLNRSDAAVATYKGTAYTGSKTTPTSLLKGSATAATNMTAYKDFALYRDEFVLSSTASVSAGHAYLPAASVPAGARILSINIGEATGIEGLTPVPSSKSEGGECWYSIDGRRLYLQPTQKGVYIYNGKVIVIK